jgi:hypothetical protein
LGIPLPGEREFKEVIMVEVLIGEMFGPDASLPLDYKRAVLVDAEEKNTKQYEGENSFTESRIILRSSDLECGSPAAAFLIDPHDSIFCEAQ